MNKIIVLLILVVAVGSVWYWYDNRDLFVVEAPSPTPTQESVPEPFDAADGTYRLDVASSSMTWRGSRPLLDSYVNSGSVAFVDGSVTIEAGQVASGAITVDMASIAVAQTGSGTGADQLTQHLAGDDFFDVAQYPTSSFRFTGLQARGDGTYLVNGELTIKDITRPLSFVASLIGEDGHITMVADDVQVDRTVWDIRFGSGSFFDDLGDRVIDDIFTVSFTIVGVQEASTGEPAPTPELE